MGIENIAIRQLCAPSVRLITPHGDRKPYHGPPIELVTAELITPHGDRKPRKRYADDGQPRVDSLPLMGIENRIQRTRYRARHTRSLPLMGIENPI